MLPEASDLLGAIHLAVLGGKFYMEDVVYITEVTQPHSAWLETVQMTHPSMSHNALVQLLLTAAAAAAAVAAVAAIAVAVSCSGSQLRSTTFQNHTGMCMIRK